MQLGIARVTGVGAALYREEGHSSISADDAEQGEEKMGKQ